MGRELLDGEGAYERYDRLKPADDTNILAEPRKESEKEIHFSEKDTETIETDNLAAILSATVDHYFPGFNEWLRCLTDRRNQDAIDYKRETIFWVALLTMLTKRGARKKIQDQMRTQTFCDNLKELCGQYDIKRVPHGDTVEYLCVRAEIEELEMLEMKIMRNLFRARIFEKYRLKDRYHTIAIDGVHIHTFSYKHCEHCLVSKDPGGKRFWLHYKLQASLVTPDGFCMPMATEWIENEGAYYDKQDCELNACYRLLEKLRRLYPRLPMCILLDSMYACDPAMEKLKKMKMEWIIVFKKGSMPEAFEWAMSKKKRIGSKNVIIHHDTKDIQARNKRSHDQRLMRMKAKHAKRKVAREVIYTWMSGIRHWDQRRSFNIITCKEVEDGEKKCDYVWIVSDDLELERNNVVELAERGRCRWTIENQGINTQKNGGYNLEHLYSRDGTGMKIWCAILDIAHIINQLIEKGSLIVRKAFGCIRNISNSMFEHFCYRVFRKSLIRPLIQIRLGWYDTS